MATSLPPNINPSTIPAAPPPPGIHPNFTNPPSLAPATIAIVATTTPLTLLLLFIRLYSTTRITRSFSYDDIASILATVFALVYTGLELSVNNTARHGWDLPITAFSGASAKKLLASEFTSALGLGFAKTSILLLLYRLFKPTRWFRWCVYVGVVWANGIALASIVDSIVLCAPRGKGEVFGSVSLAKRCGTEGTFAVAQGGLIMVLDLYILCLPMPLLSGLKLGKKSKVGVMAIFMTGSVACVASILNLVFKIKLAKSSDTLWNSWRVIHLNIIELNVAIMVACMPACASFFRHYNRKLGIISSLRSKMHSWKSSKVVFSKSSRFTTTDTNTTTTSTFSSEPKKGELGLAGRRYWKIRSPFAGTGDSAVPPQITMDGEQSRIMQRGNLNFFDESKGVTGGLEGGEESLELSEHSLERGQKSTFSEADMV